MADRDAATALSELQGDSDAAIVKDAYGGEYLFCTISRRRRILCILMSKPWTPKNGAYAAHRLLVLRGRQ
ncbi:hypothetical protein KCP74_19330 [Salmonella enterica subsp. enterica]|nr:hypothetical protein KCP74_19330 [Salmonella enterica subsp. enterica]